MFDRKAYRQQRTAEHSARLAEHQAKQTCVICEASPPVDCCWHHVDPSTKKWDVGSLVGQNRSWEFTLKEINKCAPMCRKCHTALHKAIVASSPLTPELIKLTQTFL